MENIMDKVNFDSRDWIKSNKSKTLAVFGSRSLRDERVEILILNYIQKNNITKVITCQEPEGVSEVAQRVCKKYSYPLQVHFLNMQYLRGAFEQRSKEIIHEADEFIVIHDGESKGTANELKLVKKSGKPYTYEVLEKTNYKRSVGFNIEDEWDETTNDDWFE